MATLTEIIQLSLPILGETERKIGDKTEPISLTVNGQVFDTGNFPIADNYGNLVVWSAAQGGLASFSHLIFTATADVILEFANTTPNPDERALMNVAANTMLIIPSSVMGGYASNTSRLNGAAIVSGTGFNTINEIRVQRNVATGVGAATGRLVLIL
jgi:hypothetical protein